MYLNTRTLHSLVYNLDNFRLYNFVYSFYDFYALDRDHAEFSMFQAGSDFVFMTKTKDGYRWYWKDGTFLAIYEYPKKCTDKKRYFNADLNHGYVWTNCRTSRDAESGIWTPYEMGGIAHVD